MRTRVSPLRIVTGPNRKRSLFVLCLILLALPQNLKGQQTIVASTRSVDWRQAGFALARWFGHTDARSALALEWPKNPALAKSAMNTRPLAPVCLVLSSIEVSRSH